MKVWKATHMRADGTWCIPNGEQIMVHNTNSLKFFMLVLYSNTINCMNIMDN